MLLRIAVGGTAMVQGALYLINRDQATVWTQVAGLLVTFGGASLLIGFLTPLAGGLVGLAALGAIFSWLPLPAAGWLDSKLPTVLAVFVPVAVVLLGPGAFSLDARLFGRREIVIPRAPRPSNS